MPYFIGFLVIAAIFYYAWPLILLAATCILGLLAYRQHARAGNIQLIQNCLARVKDEFVDSCLLSEHRAMHFYRITDILVRGRQGGESVFVVIDTIYWDQDLPGDACSRYAFKQNSYPSMPINWFPTDYTPEVICELIDKSLTKRGLLRIPKYSFDSKVASIIFQNYPEVVWADESLSKIEEAVQPLRHAYEVSLTNKLLASNAPLLKRALDAFQREASVLSEYGDEACRAIHQCAQFLSVPQDLRNATGCDVETLHVYDRQNDMRKSFAEVISIKKEYDNLRHG